MADGRIIIDTLINNDGAAKGLKKLTSIAGTAVVGVSAALIAMGAYAIKVGSDFEAGMSKVKAISGASAEDMVKLSNKAKEMGATTKFSATESAEALKYMAMAGWKTNDMLAGLPGIMYLAAASGESLAMVSDIVTDALTAFGLKAKDSGHFADVLAQASSNSNTNVSMLGESFKYVAPLAGALGYSVEDTSIALGLMANSSIKGSMAGTSLKTALVNMVKPTDKMKTVMDKYGLSLTNVDGTMKPLKTVMDELRTKMGGLDKATQSSAAATLFGKESLSGMLAVINASPADYEKLTGAIYNAKDAAEKMADTVNDNLQGQVVLLKSALEGLGIQFYESVNNPLKDITKSANIMVGELSKAFTEGGFAGLTKSLGEIFAQIIAGIATYAPKIIASAVIVIQSFITGIQNNLPAITTSAVQIVTSLATGILTIMPQLIILGMQLLTNILLGIAQALPQLMATGSTTITSFVDSLMVALPQLITAAIGVIQTLAKGIIDALPQMIPAIINIIEGIADTIISNIGTIIDMGIELLLALVKGIVDSLPMLIEKVPKIINDFSDAIYAQLPKILKAGVDILLMLIEGLIKSIPILIANLPQIIMAIVNVITLYNWASLGKSVISKLGEGIKSMSGNLAGIAKGVAQNGGSAITGVFRSGLSWGKNLISSIGGGFSSMRGFLGSSASSVASGALNVIKSAFSGGLNIGKNLITGIWNGISNMRGWILDKIGGFAGSIISGIKAAFDIHSPSRIMRDQVGVMLPRGIGVGFENEIPNLQKDIDSNLSNLTNKMQATVDYETAKTSTGVVASSNYKIAKDNSIATSSDAKEGDVYIVKNYMDSDEISEFTYKKVNGKFAMAGKKVR
ncbi:phage tail tape measure protein [Clostridium estertheticum]|uniref:phage tail tape measure protein n=1 Tax=Clostridium estertheticum TaxID=238834 RepID=UPI001CF45AF4|nr:phage tail tape measure protein [Clostridium estertheticum]MCB2308895.1 phage tail tape measure protein [Clostridium estertheticum]MCB2347307.1 phage tail tape measure protein [Clostridium estertheticum]MCB2351926.1 phage tail tape measure protein [Clostridium estertheticum]WAG48507.1 phage tail tape measure protein [Clostridium estertheticum]